MFRRSALTLLVAVAVTLGGFMFGQGERASADPESSDWIPQLARASAAKNGEMAPSDIEWVRARRGEAVEAISGARHEADREREVLVIQARGAFEAKHLRGRRGSGPPGGNFLIIVVDPQTRVVTDAGFTRAPSDLSRFGAVQREAASRRS